jgi:protein-disulfide isomerase
MSIFKPAGLLVAFIAGLLLVSCNEEQSGGAGDAGGRAGGSKAVKDHARPVKMAAAKGGGASSGPAALSKAQREEVRKLVRETLIRDPEIIQDALIELERRGREEEKKRQMSAFADNAETLFRSPLAPVAGNPRGKVSIVEFFDYNCPYCGKAFKHLENVMKSDPDLRIVFKEYPIFGGGSQVAARAALAARKQGKYFAFHKAMLDERGRKNESNIFRIAQKVGLDVARLKSDMKDPQIDEALAENRMLAARFGINGTPAFFVGDKLIPGAPRNLESLLRKYAADIRKNGCKHC